MDEEQLIRLAEQQKEDASMARRLLTSIGKITGRLLNRIFEIFLSFIGIIMLIPLSIVIGITNAMNGYYGPIIQSEKRMGKNGTVFNMYKFNRASSVPRTGLEAMPQVINIFLGQMSIVGPRPYRPEEKEKMGDFYKYIIQHKPGMTGISQISGQINQDFSKRLELDVKYHYRKSFGLDLKIALITLLVTLKNRNIYSDVGIQISDVATEIRKFITSVIKRIIDLIGAFFVVILLIPLTGIVAIINFIFKEDGPIFYSQERIGKNGEHFKLYKFRSMVVDADKKLEKILAENEDLRKEFEETRKLQNDPRITRVGKFLRKTSLDEFPQFISVLNGDMSLVGPRPVVDGEIELFGEHKKEVLSVKPGITGYWAANGRSNTSYPERVEMETYYANNVSILLDIKIILKTIIAVVKKEGSV